MQLEVISLFPEMVRDAMDWGVCGRALERGHISLSCVNPRDYTQDAHQTVDDRPYGGGPGMVMKFEPLAAAVEAASSRMPTGSRVVFLGPQGRVFDQAVARELTALPGMVLVCGRYEGFDERLLQRYADDEVSLGDYVISGGELAALVVIDAVVRLLPGVLGDAASAEQDSFTDDLLDCPHYTRPEAVAGMQVPGVLLQGDHAAIRRWRLKQALGRTRERRPELLAQRGLSAEEQQLVEEYLRDKPVAGSATEK